MDLYYLAAFSEWLINLSAGWFASVFVIPAFVSRSKKVSLWLLTANIILAILSLLAAIEVKRFLGEL